MIAERPRTDEAAEYYFTYINKVPEGDILATLQAQLPETIALFSSVSEDRSLYRYAADKWTLREALGHVNDTERLFVFRAFWFARGLDVELPSFDQNVAVARSNANDRTWASLVEEFKTIRESSLAFYKSLSPDAWTRRGIASGNPFSVRALAYITAGHVEHHNGILRERYLAR